MRDEFSSSADRPIGNVSPKLAEKFSDEIRSRCAELNEKTRAGMLGLVVGQLIKNGMRPASDHAHEVEMLGAAWRSVRRSMWEPFRDGLICLACEEGGHDD